MNYIMAELWPALQAQKVIAQAVRNGDWSQAWDLGAPTSDLTAQQKADAQAIHQAVSKLKEGLDVEGAFTAEMAKVNHPRYQAEYSKWALAVARWKMLRRMPDDDALTAYDTYLNWFDSMLKEAAKYTLAQQTAIHDAKARLIAELQWCARNQVYDFMLKDAAGNVVNPLGKEMEWDKIAVDPPHLGELITLSTAIVLGVVALGSLGLTYAIVKAWKHDPQVVLQSAAFQLSATYAGSHSKCIQMAAYCRERSDIEGEKRWLEAAALALYNANEALAKAQSYSTSATIRSVSSTVLLAGLAVGALVVFGKMKK